MTSDIRIEFTTFVPDLRDDLLDRVGDGRLTPEQAEAEAARLEIGPLACSPDPGRFDPFDYSRWSLAMVLAWIVWRTPSAVREQMQGWRSGVFVWTPHEWTFATGERRVGHHLESLDRSAPFHALCFMEACRQRDEREMLSTVKEARLDLWRRLADDELTAEGVREGEPVSIPSKEWPWLENMPLNERVDAWRLTTSGYPFPIRYTEIVVRLADVIRLWPPANDTPADATAPVTAVNPLHARIRELAASLPSHLSAKERDRKICEGLGKNVSQSTIKTALQGTPSIKARPNRRKAGH